jgi:hypothetical protein
MLEGYAYLAKDRDNDRCKIGRSYRLPSRMQALGRTLARLDLFHAIYTNHASRLERDTHRRFSRFSIDREWFQFVPEVFVPFTAVSSVVYRADAPHYPPPSCETRPRTTPFGVLVYAARRRSKIPLRRLAASMSVSQTFAFDYEMGFAVPPEHHLAKMSALLGIPLDQLRNTLPRR